MNKAVLTCVSCGAKQTVTNDIEAKRGTICAICGSPTIERRQPGSVL